MKHFEYNDILLSINYTYGLNLIKNKVPQMNNQTNKADKK